MKKTLLIVLVIVIVIASSITIIPNPLGSWVRHELKARGYIPYTPEEAVTLAYTRCTICHDEQKVLKYCSRCGPPIIAVVHDMKRNIELANKKEGRNIRELTDPEAVAITQVWNALVGNWESDWPRKDIATLLKGDKALLKLFETPIEKRPIESALKGKSAPGAYKEVQKKGMKTLKKELENAPETKR